ncbi:MAG: MarR family transcriptional regulator [Pseudomonadota bacterium]
MEDVKIRDEDYAMLATFRYELRRFLQFSERAADDAGVTAQQHQALLAIRAASGAAMPVGALAERMMLRPHSTTGLIDRLQKLDLVERFPADGDRRQVLVRLTLMGEKLLATLSEAHRAELRRLKPLLTSLMERV